MKNVKKRIKRKVTERNLKWPITWKDVQAN